MQTRLIEPITGDALLIVDVQKDFLSGGALAVPQGEQVIEPLNRWIEHFHAAGLLVIATRDWHPPNHCSFDGSCRNRSEGESPWPVHCVAETEGAEFPAELALPKETLVVSKGMQPDQEAYSGFQGTNLATRLHKRGIERLFVGGLATDYCVLETVLDALREGFQVFLIRDAVRAVNRQPGDGGRAIRQMQESGALLVHTRDLAT